MSEDLIVTVQDLRASRLCFQGARPWFRRHGLDWQAFLADGLSADVLAATGDALALCWRRAQFSTRLMTKQSLSLASMIMAGMAFC